MAKGQLRGNKEVKKAKKAKDTTVPVSGFLPQGQHQSPGKPK